MEPPLHVKDSALRFIRLGPETADFLTSTSFYRLHWPPNPTATYALPIAHVAELRHLLTAQYASYVYHRCQWQADIHVEEGPSERSYQVRPSSTIFTR